MAQKTCCGHMASPPQEQPPQTGCCGSGRTTAPAKEQAACGCSSQAANADEYSALSSVANAAWIIGQQETPAGTIPLVTPELSAADRMGGWKVRWGINRMQYTVPPGLYGIGHPDADSPVLVTANYKLTFDTLRRELSGINAWILVLDTRGVNVWCAAGKGTFGTEELVRRLHAVRLTEIVSHRTLIVPQLGATGVAAHEVQKAANFKVIYGPVRANDIPAFLANNYQKTAAMRTVTFSLPERLSVIPVELVSTFKPAGLLLLFLLLLRLVNKQAGDEWRVVLDFLPYAGAILLGVVIFPILLPYLPSRSFAIKGALLGLIWGIVVSVIAHFSLGGSLMLIFLLTALTSFFSLNFTGSTTFTSLSGARLEVQTAVPLMIGAVVLGFLINVFV